MAEFISLKEGVSNTLKKGDTVCFEGFTHLIPHASAHEVVRQKIDNLTIIRMTPDVIYDQLIGIFNCPIYMHISKHFSSGFHALIKVVIFFIFCH